MAQRTSPSRKTPSRKPSSRKSSSRFTWARIWPWLLKLGVAVSIPLIIYTVWLDAKVRSSLTEHMYIAPAQVYARALHLYPEMPLRADDLQRELDQLGYRSTKSLGQPGDMVRAGSSFQIYRRAFAFENGPQPAQKLKVFISDQRVISLRDGDDEPLDLAQLDPLSLGGMFTARREDRLLVQLKEVPRQLVDTLLAVEDRHFYGHWGVSPKSIGRAMVANVIAGRTVQGGSTLTQQLIKNVYLTNERSVVRKLNEALMAMLLEYHYSKDIILEAYLNEIYLGQEGSRAIHGFALAARHYFNQPLNELRDDQIAMLVGLVKGPSQYDPWRSPQRARERRNLVLQVMKDNQLLDADELAAAQQRPLGLAKTNAYDSLHPAYLDLVRRQLQRDYLEKDLQEKGLRIFTAFDPQLQRHAEESLSKSLEQLDPKKKGLDGAMVVTDIVSGEVVAVVGGRQMHFAGFNRALDAVRPIGSLIKPVVYLAALEQAPKYTLTSLLSDTPVNVKVPGGRWQPKNYDKQFHGAVPLHVALAQSYNAATAHLGLDVGVKNVLKTVQRLGISRPLPEVPAVLLGAGALSPVEVAAMYQTLAAQGVSAGLRSVRAVTSSDGKPLARYPQKPEQAVSPAAIHLVQFAMQEVMQDGTGRAASHVMPGYRLAGKTGTTDDMRDSWFAGFAGDYLAVVWMGRDDNQSMGLSGASGALKPWITFMKQASHVPLDAEAPAGVQYAWIEEQSGLLSADGCPGARQIPFIAGSVPTQASSCGDIAPAAADVVDFFKNMFR